MSFISISDKVSHEEIRLQCNKILLALAEAETKRQDDNLRSRLRRTLRVAAENGLSLGLSDGRTAFGKAIAHCNRRSHVMGWM